MVALTAAKAVNMPGLGTLVAQLDAVPTQFSANSVTFHSTPLNFDLVLTGSFTIGLGPSINGTIQALEFQIPKDTFAFKFSGLSAPFSLPGSGLPILPDQLGGSDTFNGSPSNDVLLTYGGDDILRGNNGNDTLNGGADKDLLIGGRGRDLLYGGTERDLFDFNSIRDSVRGAKRDNILDFKHGTNITGDDIDLRTIDAKTGVGGNQAFKWIGKQGFHDVKGELRYIDKGATCIVQGDVNGDGKTDFEIFVKIGSLTKGDFLL